MSQPELNMLIFEMKIIDKIGAFYKIQISHSNLHTVIAFSPRHRTLIFLYNDYLTHLLDKNEYQIRKLLHNKRISTYYVGFKIKFAIRDNKKVQLFNDPSRIIVLDRRNNKYLSYTKSTPDPNAIEIFTDGCYIHEQHKGGYAALIKKNNGLYDLVWGHTDEPSNSTLLELLAAIKGLEYIPDNITKIRIITDSRYVIKGLTEWVINWKLNDWYTIQGRKVRNIKYWKKFDKLTQNKYIEFKWVKGHSLHYENTITDFYAKKAAQLKPNHNSHYPKNRSFPFINKPLKPSYNAKNNHNIH